MKKILILSISAILMLSGCASGPKYAELKPSLPELTNKEEQGRIFFYRTKSPVGAAVTSNIKVNNEVVGVSRPGGFFFIDQKAGNIDISTKTEAEKNLNFALEPGQIRYVRTKVSMGALVGRIVPELIDNETAEKEIQGSSYIGNIDLNTSTIATETP